jgi:hypothetical protein
MVKLNGPPRGKRWIWLTDELIDSDAFCSLSVNAFRFIRALMSQHMKRGGRGNGHLIATRRQLQKAGISARCVSDAIEQAKSLGLVDLKRGIGRRPSTYALTWLPLADGTPASDRWRTPEPPSKRRAQASAKARSRNAGAPAHK